MLRQKWYSFKFHIKGIPRLFKWYKVIVSTRPWDYVYLLMIHRQVLKEFLEDQEKCHAEEHIIRDLKICLEILDRQVNEEYLLKDAEKEKADMDMYFKLMNKRIFRLWT